MPKPHYPAKFKQEAANLVLDQGYTRKAACEAMGVSKTSLDRWIRQLRAERAGEMPEKAQAITLKAHIKRLEREKTILKKATALLMSAAGLVRHRTKHLLRLTTP